MAKQRDKRLDDLERDTGPGDEVKVNVNWRTDDLIEDEDTGEFVTRDEWKRRHPHDRLIILTWGDDDDDLPDPVPAA